MGHGEGLALSATDVAPVTTRGPAAGAEAQPACTTSSKLPAGCIRQSYCYPDGLGNKLRCRCCQSPRTRCSTLDTLILKTLTRGPSHGYAVARFIEETSGDAVLVEEGSLYPALYRLERRGWVEAEWGTSELGRRAKLYRLTDSGRAQLAAEMATWRRFSAGVSKVLFST